MKTLLITGGCGFIGSHFIRLLLREKPQWRIINLDLLTYAGNVDNPSDLNLAQDDSAYRFVRGDFADSSLLRQVFQTESPNAIVNFAAETHVDRSLLDSAPFARTNIEEVCVFLEFAVQYGIKIFWRVSTDEVYGSFKPHQERRISKVLAEMYSERLKNQG
ncbi:MAG TPA: GDP-mannose 4,6-dehydratase [Candidatus Binatia bacterium]|nr:GDP-mannose 4,6-dehydratase [Candidatus Binatia bacterium]